MQALIKTQPCSSTSLTECSDSPCLVQAMSTGVKEREREKKKDGHSTQPSRCTSSEERGTRGNRDVNVIYIQYISRCFGHNLSILEKYLNIPGNSRWTADKAGFFPLLLKQSHSVNVNHAGPTAKSCSFPLCEKTVAVFLNHLQQP